MIYCVTKCEYLHFILDVRSPASKRVEGYEEPSGDTANIGDGPGNFNKSQ